VAWGVEEAAGGKAGSEGMIEDEDDEGEELLEEGKEMLEELESVMLTDSRGEWEDGERGVSLEGEALLRGVEVEESFPAFIVTIQ
jgi:hypothetical protein